jgi:hypothetical protein
VLKNEIAVESKRLSVLFLERCDLTPQKNWEKLWSSSQLGVFVVYYTRPAVVEAALSGQQKGSYDEMHG